jgi:peptide/nickel transport system substrate-binding protein
MEKRLLKRREFLKLSATAAIGAAAAACAPTPEIIEKEVVKEVTKVVEKEVEKEVEVTKIVEVEKEVEKQVTVVVEKGAPEPPLLADKVASGALPPLAERLPVSPAVVTGREAIGDYGGEVRMIHFDPVWFVSEYGWFSERMLHYSDLDLRTIVGNLFESWEMSEDGTTYTVHLRPGAKWSDGQPLTTEDIAFWWFDQVLNEDLSGGPGWQYRQGGDVMQMEIMDDFTFRFTFAGPFGNFAAYLTRWHWGNDWITPKHYMSQFHADYADQADLDAMIAELNLEDWSGLYWNKNGWGINIWQGPDNATEYPSLSGWLIIERPEEGLYIWERNPYYWKVDQLGNQLPYIDNVRIDYVASIENVTLKIMQSELDYVGPHDVTIARYPLYKENEPGSNYIVGDYLSCMTDRYTLYPQHNLADKVLEEIVNHPNFVKALSVAIDREEINQSLFFGLARMGQLGPMPMSKYYKEKYGTAWAQYDPELANELLDEMGLDQRDAEGWRLRADGERLRFNIEHPGARVGASASEFAEMVVTFWREVGIDATTREIQEALYNERLGAGELHCAFWHADRATDLLLPIEMRWYIPTDTGQGGPAQKWAQWFMAANKDEEGLEEPPDYIKQLFEYYDMMNAVTDEDERVMWGQKIFDYLAENPLSIGSILESPAPLILNKNLRNLPRPKVPIGWDSYGISTYHPEAFFYEGGQRA